MLLLQSYRLVVLTVVTVFQPSGAVVTVLQARGANCCYSISG